MSSSSKPANAADACGRFAVVGCAEIGAHLGALALTKRGFIIDPALGEASIPPMVAAN